MRPLRFVPLLVAAALAGCASEESAPSPATSPSPEPSAPPTPAPAPKPPPEAWLSVATAGQYPVDPRFEPRTLAVAAGARVTLDFRNGDAAPIVEHDWVLDGVDGARTDVVSPGESTTVTFTAPTSGEYVYYCSVGDHRARGMEGRWTVSA